MDAVLNEKKLTIVDEVLDDMRESYQTFSNWRSYWTETYKNCVLTDECFRLSDEDFTSLSLECNKINRNDATNKSCDKALKVIWFDESHRYGCGVGTICWDNIRTKRSIRHMSFNSDGTITIQKKLYQPIHDVLYHQHLYHSGIEYEAEYNVNFNNFHISTKVVNKGRTIDNLEIIVQDGVIIKKINGIELIEDLHTHLKYINIRQPYVKENKNSNADVEFKATIDSDSKLESGSLIINTHKGNGKVNGSYRMIASKENGVSARFISRNGKTIDLRDNLLLLGQNNSLRLNASNQSSAIVNSFSNSTRDILCDNMESKFIKFDASLFSTEAIREADDKLTNTLRRIICELPCSGLINRISNYLLINNTNYQQESNKVLRLSEKKSTN